MPKKQTYSQQWKNYLKQHPDVSERDMIRKLTSDHVSIRAILNELGMNSAQYSAYEWFKDKAAQHGIISQGIGMIWKDTNV